MVLLHRLVASGIGNAASDGRVTLTRGELFDAVDRLARELRARSPHCIGFVVDNGLPWLLIDLAAAEAGIPAVPLPPFFSHSQLSHAVKAAGVELLIGADPDLAAACEFVATKPLPGIGARAWSGGTGSVALPIRTVKITFTSGTTGAPKGVCLSLENQLRVAQGLVEVTAAMELDRHLCLLPLAVLLENIAGVYAVLMANAECVAPPLDRVGVSGSSRFDVRAALRAITEVGANSVILLPQMLQALVHAIEQGAERPACLRFVAVGGGKVAPSLLRRAERARLPVFEGYGLSESASVVALNTPTAARPGSVGRVLPHAAVCIAPDGEIVVEGNAFQGYLGGPPNERERIATGDLGYVDDDGFLYLSGRKRHVLVTAYGRNISPEWPEAELATEAEIAQAAVFGDARPYCIAVLVPRVPDVSDAALQGALRKVNGRLPDYARIAAFVRADGAFSASNGLMTANGRLRRDAINAHYRERIETLYLSA